MKKIANIFERLINKVIATLRSLLKMNRPMSFSNVEFFSNDNEVIILGRVIEKAPFLDFDSKSSLVSHFFNVLRLFLSFKVPDLKVKALGECVVTNSEGYFKMRAALPEPLQNKKPHLATLETEARNYKGEKVHAQMTLSIPPTSGSLGELIISDVDDTVLKSRATSFWRLTFNTLFMPVHKRQAFPEASEIYQKMKMAKSAGENNLFFYISSSTWNIYPLLASFLRTNRFPHGPLILQDMKGDEALNVEFSHGHKLKKISEIAEFYPNLNMILIGDAGQEDATIYLSVAEKFPSRVKRILIRKSWWEGGFVEPQENLDLAKRLGVEMLYFDDLTQIIRD